MFRKTEKPFKRFYKGAKLYIRRLSGLIKAFLIVLLVMFLVVLFNSVKNTVKIHLVNTFYSIYGYSSQFITSLYNKVDEFSFCITEKLYDSATQRENKYLKLQNSILDEQIKLLKSNMRLIENSHYNYITAMVTQITYPKDEVALVVSAGEKDGIKPGNIVVDKDGIIGRISTVTSTYSLVSIIGNGNVKISAIVLPSQENCIVGQRSDPYHLELNYISDIEKVNDGDNVISSGKDGFTPYGISIGIIRKINGRAFVVQDRSSINNTIVKIITSNTQP